MNRLYQELEQYHQQDVYPFHMPGHKRRAGSMPEYFPVEKDITEITGFDDLHHPEEIILQAQKRAAKLFGAEETYFCVNGSTGAILSAISASVKRGGQILAARNCHKSVYHAMYLRDLRPSYIYPQYSKNMGINGGISPDAVERALEENPEIEAVMITSPTYDGVVSDVAGIAEIAHRFGIPLIVDEAHGAHFVFSDLFPKSAVQLGADLVIHSVHKTLPSLTQTALLHRCSDRVSRELLRRFQGIYQTSSPSYLLMSSMDACITRLEQEGASMFEAYAVQLQRTRQRLGENVHLQLITPEKTEEIGWYDYDISKILISTACSSLEGPQLHRILREKYRLELEMKTADYVLALSSVEDTEEGFERLCNAIEELDREDSGADTEKTAQEDNSEFVRVCSEKRQYMSIAEAMDSEYRTCPLEESIGKISCEFGYLYPPGIPLIVPGEQITGLFVRNVRRYMDQGLNFVGLSDETSQTIHVVKE